MNQYFGHYLLNKGVLTPIQLSDVLQHERTVKMKLGVLAMNAGLMTAAQVEEVHDLQRIKDQKFGELAIAQGYLTEAQVEKMLVAQHDSHLALLQAISDGGYMTMPELEKTLATFRQEYGGIDLGSSATNEDELVRKLLDFSTAGDNADFLYNYVGLMLRNVVRFLNDTPFIVAGPATSSAFSWLVSQQIVGEISVSTSLYMDERVLLEIASRFYAEPFASVNELALDCAGEFLNVHNGVWCGSLSDHGCKVDLLPQSIVNQREAPLAAETYRVIVGTSFGNFEIILSVLA
jgi:CheY-specific phosphatase CheX